MTGTFVVNKKQQRKIEFVKQWNMTWIAITLHTSLLPRKLPKCRKRTNWMSVTSGLVASTTCVWQITGRFDNENISSSVKLRMMFSLELN